MKRNFGQGGNARGRFGAPMTMSKGGILCPAHAAGAWRVEIFDRNGRKEHEELIHNIVVTEGENYLLSIGLDAGTQITSWFVGLLSATPTVAAGDVMNSHSGWTEVTAYDEANRQTWTGGTASAGSINNSASPAVMTISADSTQIGGAFLTSNNTKGGTTGTLYAAGAFTGGNITLNDGSTVTVTATFSV
jgi:hypothetical protein